MHWIGNARFSRAYVVLGLALAGVVDKQRIDALDGARRRGPRRQDRTGLKGDFFAEQALDQDQRQRQPDCEACGSVVQNNPKGYIHMSSVVARSAERAQHRRR